MIDKVRAKLSLNSIKEYFYAGQPTGYSKVVEFSTQYDDKIPEDQRFLKATPSGNFTMNLDNPLALEFFKSAKSFYVDFIIADPLDPPK